MAGILYSACQNPITPGKVKPISEEVIPWTKISCANWRSVSDRSTRRQRLGIETDHEAQIFGKGLIFFHIGNWYPVHSVIRNALKLTGLYWRARRNTGRILVKRNDVMFKELPPLFDGFTILHLSDMHVDMNEGAMRRLIELVGGMRYDLCVLTGDYRGKNFGPFEATLDGVARVRAHLEQPIYGVLGDHDTIQMVPGLEAMGIRILLNECEVIVRGNQQIYLAGIDDAHYFRVDNIEKAALQIPYGEFSILLSHTPEIYRQAAHADFNLLLSGHTHGGQICLPGLFRSYLRQYCLDGWVRELGSITT